MEIKGANWDHLEALLGLRGNRARRRGKWANLQMGFGRNRRVRLWEDPETGSSLCGTAEQRAESLAELLVNRLNPRQRPMSERSPLTAPR